MGTLEWLGTLQPFPPPSLVPGLWEWGEEGGDLITYPSWPRMSIQFVKIAVLTGGINRHHCRRIVTELVMCVRVYVCSDRTRRNSVVGAPNCRYITMVKPGSEASYKISQVCCHLCCYQCAMQATMPRDTALCTLHYGFIISIFNIILTWDIVHMSIGTESAPCAFVVNCTYLRAYL